MKKLLKLSLVLAAIQVASCSTVQGLIASNDAPIDYVEGASKINVKNFLNGNLEGFAISQNNDGKIIATYTTKVSGKWEENKGTIQYDYIIGNKKDSRTWLITLDDNGNYGAIGHDFIAPAKGRTMGNTAVVVYDLMIPYQDKKQKITFEDKIYLVDDKSAIVISKMKKNRSPISTSIISLKKVNKD